jgi:hypothetical protein
MNNVIEFPTEPAKAINGRLPWVLDLETSVFDRLVRTARLFDTSVDDVLERIINKEFRYETSDQGDRR